MMTAVMDSTMTDSTAIHSTAIRFQQGNLWVLDQQKLPGEEIWIESKNPDDMCEIIHSLKVRGAPLIGVAAALSLWHFALQLIARENTRNKGDKWDKWDKGDKGDKENERSESISKDVLKEFEAAALRLRAARPTAVNLMFCVDKILDAVHKANGNLKVVQDVAHRIYQEDVELCQKMAQHGFPLIESGDGVLTYCNSGSLATAGVGTALGVIIEAYKSGKNIHVYPCETRPLLQGARLSAWELSQAKVPHTLICDNMAGYLMAQGKIQKIFVGADRIAANGDFANKIGTYSVAVLARHHNIPFYVVAPYTTVDMNSPTGKEIVVEERSQEEVRGASGSFGNVIWSPKNVATYNPSFDVTPAELVTGFILDGGVLLKPHINADGLRSLQCGL